MANGASAPFLYLREFTHVGQARVLCNFAVGCYIYEAEVKSSLQLQREEANGAFEAASHHVP